MIGWQKALILWLQGKVDILEYHEVHVRSASQSFQLPSVLRLRKFIHRKYAQQVRFSRPNIYLRDDHTCQYCAKKFPTKELTLDHVMPVSRGGQHTWDNVVAACGKCNNKKGNRTPSEARMPLLRTPAKPKWLPYNELGLKKNSTPDIWVDYLPHGVVWN